MVDDRDFHEIQTRLRGIMAAIRIIDTLTASYEVGSVTLSGAHVITLTTAQKAKLKTAAGSIRAKLKRASDALAAPTGLVGVVNAEVKAKVEGNPPLAFRLLEEFAGELAAVELPVSQQADDTFRFEFPASFAQQTADRLATLGAATKVFLAVFAARVA